MTEEASKKMPRTHTHGRDSHFYEYFYRLHFSCVFLCQQMLCKLWHFSFLFVRCLFSAFGFHIVLFHFGHDEYRKPDTIHFYYVSHNSMCVCARPYLFYENDININVSFFQRIFCVTIR